MSVEKHEHKEYAGGGFVFFVLGVFCVFFVMIVTVRQHVMAIEKALAAKGIVVQVK